MDNNLEMLGSILRMANTGAWGGPITFAVHGQLVSGTLISRTAYVELLEPQLLDGFRSADRPLDAVAGSDYIPELFSEEWRTNPLQGSTDAALTPDCAYLKDVVIQQPTGTALRVPLWTVMTSHIGGWTLTPLGVLPR